MPNHVHVHMYMNLVTASAIIIVACGLSGPWTYAICRQIGVTPTTTTPLSTHVAMHIQETPCAVLKFSILRNFTKNYTNECIAHLVKLKLVPTLQRLLGCLGICHRPNIHYYTFRSH
jgi:hypothetical protein